MNRLFSAVGLAGLIAIASGTARAAPPMSEVLEAQNLRDSVCALFEFEGSFEPTFLSLDFPLLPDTRWKEPAETVLPGIPAFVEGHSGQGVLVEEGTTNLLSASASGQAEVLSDFRAVRGAGLTLDGTGALAGDNCLKVTAPGKVVGEGFYVALPGQAGQALAGSLSLRGTGTVCLRMLDMTNYVPAAPVYALLTPEWRRYALPAANLETAASSEVRLLVTTAGTEPATFWADALQVEAREYVTSWVPGGVTREDRQLVYPLTGEAWKLPEGSVLMWVRPHWDQAMTLGKGREFFTSVYGEPCLFWTGYNTLGSIPLQGYQHLGGGGNLFAGGWQFFAVSWTPEETRLCHNAKTVVTKKGAALSKAKSFRLGPSGNAVIDQWVILKKALTVAEMQAVYEGSK